MRRIVALPLLHLELIHQLHLVIGQVVELAADFRRFRGLFGHGALLFGGPGDLQVHVADHRHRFADIGSPRVFMSEGHASYLRYHHWAS